MNIIEVAAGLVFREGRLLITQRPVQAHLGRLWEFPGGKREPGESFEQCLLRELREELGIEVSVGALLQRLTHTYPEKTVHIRFYRCEWKASEPKPIGCDDFKWVGQGQLKDFQFPAADQQLLARLEREAGLWHSGPLPRDDDLT
jgi:8-oxo-dGTP diphosphatase